MSTVLDTDREFAERLPRVMIVPASAGSGKTTELTRQLIQLLLSDAIPRSDFSNILAITFTNNAALEMRQRVLKTLKEVHFGSSDEEGTLARILPDSAGRIRADAGMLVTQLLERYSEFHVQTIDSFLARVFKASAVDFGFSPGFAIRLASDPLIDEAFEAVLRSMGDDSAEAALFHQLVDLAMESGRSDGRFIWNPSEELSREVKLLYRRLVQYAADVRVEDHSAQIRRHGEDLIACVIELDRRSEEAGFKRKSDFEKYLHEAQQGHIDRLLALKFPDPPIVKTGVKQADYERWVRESEPLTAKIRSLRSALSSLRARQYFLPYARALEALEKTIDQARRERGEVDIGEVSRRLARFLSSDVVPELYFKLGEEIRHFLIDEFQDTSPVQWHVLRPLIENALSVGGSLFVVGDLKQSIYSFRGADWRIMANLLSSNPFPMAGDPVIRPLDTNHRSAERILEFNRTVFQSIVPGVITNGAESASGLSSYRQEPSPALKGKGHVETIFLNRDDEARPERAAVLEIVTDCLARGYQKRDIAILSPTNDAVIAVSAWLNEVPVDFLSHSSLDIRSRKVTSEVIAFLKFLDSPVDDLSFATVLLGEVLANVVRGSFSGLKPETIHDFVRETLSGQASTRPLYTLFRDRFPQIWMMAFEEAFTRVGYLPLYDLLAGICSTLRLFDAMPEEEATIVKLLEVAEEFERDGTSTVRDFLRYCEEDSEEADWTMALPTDADAVRIMTVHKAKGLGFKVVVVLLYDGQPRTDPVALIEEEDGVVLVRLTKEAEEVDALAELYRTKRQNEDVDRLNKLYVALTRAREELYVVSVQRARAAQPSQFLPKSGYERPRERQAASPGHERAERSFTLVHHHHRMREEPHTFSKISKAQTTRGDFIHGVLARIIHSEEDLSSQLATAIRSVEVLSREALPLGTLGELRLYQESLVRFLEHPDVQPLFRSQEGRTVFTEREFCDRMGRLHRMDRVVVDSDQVIVVDFKTGGESQEYDEQLRDYMAILRELYPAQKVRGVVAYVDELMLRDVAERSAGEP